jgi:prepilin signal peptidase PulO-like enzyme (type II secretory pathway)
LFCFFSFIGGISLLKNREKNQEFTTLLQTQIPFAPYLCFAGLTVYLLQETGAQNFVIVFDYF